MCCLKLYKRTIIKKRKEFRDGVAFFPCLFTTFSCYLCQSWVLPSLALADWVQWCCTELLCAFLLDYFAGCIAYNHKPRRRFNPIVQGNSLFTVTGQETCAYWLLLNQLNLQFDFEVLLILYNLHQLSKQKPSYVLHDVSLNKSIKGFDEWLA